MRGYLNVDLRMNLFNQEIEIKNKIFTRDFEPLQRAVDFLKAFIMGFNTQDASGLLYSDDVHVESFEIKAIKLIQGAHLIRTKGRILGKSGITKISIENSTKTRILLSD